MNISSVNRKHHVRAELELLYEGNLEECTLPNHCYRNGEIKSVLKQQNFVGIFSLGW